MSETRRRKNLVMVRLDDIELEELAEKSASAGMSKPSYLRRSMMGRRIDHSARSTSESLRQLARIGSNLNQMTRLSHLGESNLRLLSEAIREVSDAARRVGREGAE